MPEGAGTTGHAYIVGASMYGGPTDPSSGTVGSCGESLVGKNAIAELDMGTALGGLPCGTKLIIQMHGGNGATVEVEKLDIGLGGSPIQGHERRVDIWYQVAAQIGFKGTGLINIRRADGKPIKGPHDTESLSKSEAQGAGFFGTGIGPNVATEASETVKNGVEGALSWTGDLAKLLTFITSSSGWVRIGKVALGAVLLVVAIDELSKIGPGPSTNIKSGAVDTAKKGAEIAALF